jgi:hypothetical protein
VPQAVDSHRGIHSIQRGIPLLSASMLRDIFGSFSLLFQEDCLHTLFLFSEILILKLEHVY